jgi:multidrug efflux pump subunit AcrA (membrane-fusion protein)
MSIRKRPWRYERSMKIKGFRQSQRFNHYTLLWAAALVTVIYLYFHWFVTMNYIGIVEKKSHFLGPQEPGRVETLLVKEGDPVRKDQMLAMLDVSDLTAFLSNLQDEIAKGKALDRALEGRSAIEVQRLRLQVENEASDLLERISLIESKAAELAGLNAQIKRLEDAEKAGLGTSRDLSGFVLQRDALEAYLRLQRRELTRLSETSNDIRNARRRLAKAGLDSMTQSLLAEQMEHAEELRREIVVTENRIRLRTLVSPCDGVVTDINAWPGDLVRDFNTAITIEGDQPEFMNVYLPEKTTLRPEYGMRAKIFSARGRKYNTAGTVTFVHPDISRAPERLSFRGQVFWARKVLVTLDSSHALLPGEVVNVRLEKNVRASAEEGGHYPTHGSRLPESGRKGGGTGAKAAGPSASEGL